MNSQKQIKQIIRIGWPITIWARPGKQQPRRRYSRELLAANDRLYQLRAEHQAQVRGQVVDHE